MSNQEIYDELEAIKDMLFWVTRDLDDKANKFVLNKALELIDTVSWQYEEDEYND